MEPKKYPIRHLIGKRGLYFLIVLVVLLALLYVALEWKSPPDNRGYDLYDDREEPQYPKDSSAQ